MPRRELTIFLTHEAASRANYYGERALAELSALGEVRLNDGDVPLSSKALVAAAQDCQVIVADRVTPGQAALFDGAPALVAFLRCAVDIRTVDVAAASRNGILVTNASPGFASAVAELVVGMMIDLARGITAAAGAYRKGRVPAARMGVQLAGSTLGILGYGTIGRRLAEIGRALDMTVLVHDPHKTIEAPGIAALGFDAVLAQADFVVCLAVADEATENLIDAAALAGMKRSAYFINAARGNLVDETALKAALEGGRIAGAAFDVGRAPDQMPSPDLAALANAIATPHIGGLTPAATRAQAMETVAQVRALTEGQMPHNAINPAEAHRLDRLGIARDATRGAR